jgi:hypothetical protein
MSRVKFLSAENGQRGKVRWWGLRHDGRGATSLIAGGTITKHNKTSAFSKFVYLGLCIVLTVLINQMGQ